MWPFAERPAPTPRRAASGEDHLQRLDRAAGEVVPRFGPLLVIFLRALAAIWMIRGLTVWSLILGFSGEPGAFENGRLLWQTTTVGLAIFSCVAAVGLWLTASWGAVLWVGVTLGELTLPLLLPALYPTWPTASLGALVLCLVYFVLSFLAAREHKNIERLHST